MASMIPLASMALGAIGIAVAAAAIAASRGYPQLGPSIFGGMVGPLVAALATWVLVTHTFRRNPAALTNLMIAAFGVKAVFFGIYAVAMVRMFGLDVAAFGLSFAGFFIALYAVEAALFARLFQSAQGMR
jgi:hypothetical protein